VNLRTIDKVGIAVAALALAFLGGRSSVRVREVERRVLVTSEATKEARTSAYVGHVEKQSSTVTRWKVRTVVRIDGSSEREETGETGTKEEIKAAEVATAAEEKHETKATKDETIHEVNPARPDWLGSVWVSADRDLARSYDASLSRRIIGPFFVGVKLGRSVGWSAGLGITAEY
jgi:hypothetical protein